MLTGFVEAWLNLPVARYWRLPHLPSHLGFAANPCASMPCKPMPRAAVQGPERAPQAIAKAAGGLRSAAPSSLHRAHPARGCRKAEKSWIMDKMHCISGSVISCQCGIHGHRSHPSFFFSGTLTYLFAPHVMCTLTNRGADCPGAETYATELCACVSGSKS